jgi:hypothetical protein
MIPEIEFVSLHVVERPSATTSYPLALRRDTEGLLRGCPAWTRTKNNASKGRCVTITPQGNRLPRLSVLRESATIRTKNSPERSSGYAVPAPIICSMQGSAAETQTLQMAKLSKWRSPMAMMATLALESAMASESAAAE